MASGLLGSSQDGSALASASAPSFSPQGGSNMGVRPAYPGWFFASRINPQKVLEGEELSEAEIADLKSYFLHTVYHFVNPDGSHVENPDFK